MSDIAMYCLTAVCLGKDRGEADFTYFGHTFPFCHPHFSGTHFKCFFINFVFRYSTFPLTIIWPYQ